MKIELLYFSGCPTYKKAEGILSEAMRELGIDEPIERINVQSEQEAKERKFLGSPTIRINGLDVDESVRGITDYAFECRLYQTREGLLGWPSKEMVIKALKEAKQ
ncbi:MAG: DUF2703 domain-containing protein [Actinomycetota bacterium]|nr:DUF2703 domain-containing protein [Actinomycetota bacterium]